MCHFDKNHGKAAVEASCWLIAGDVWATVVSNVWTEHTRLTCQLRGQNRLSGTQAAFINSAAFIPSTPSTLAGVEHSK